MKNNKSFTDSESGLNDLKGFRKGTADFFSWDLRPSTKTADDLKSHLVP